MPNAHNYTPDQSIAAIATALAPSALAVIRTSGKDVINLLAEIFSRPKALLQSKGNEMLYGWIVDKKTDTKVDEVMLGVYRAPKSFTGENMVEIYCHGGTSPVLAVFNLLLKNGFRQAERGEFTFRAFINGKTDLTKAEAVREIIDSHTDESRSRAAGRLAGNLFDRIDAIKKLIIDTLAEIEVKIEYPEDEETIANAFDRTNLIIAKDTLNELSRSWSAEKLYQDGARIMLCGRTNAGKSSLFNVLLKEDRAIVSDIEGTTRDWLESWISFNGIPARLFDTAGLRITSDTIEQKGVEMTKDLSRDADLILYVIDSSSGINSEDKAFIREAQKNDTPVLLVWNKCDKESQPPRDLSELETEKVYQADVSAKLGSGIAELTALVCKILCKSESTERAVCGLGSERQKIAVDEALESVTHALEVTDDGAQKSDTDGFAVDFGDSLPLDAVVQDLENALDSLSEITGEVQADDILDSIFSRFCVGK